MIHSLTPPIQFGGMRHFLLTLFKIVLDLAKITKDAVQKRQMLAWQYNTVGVSDAITMGDESKPFLFCSTSNPQSCFAKGYMVWYGKLFLSLTL
jgi:hypothetical protein